MIRRVWSEQVRVTFWAWVATLCAAAMLAPLTSSKRYLVIGAIGHLAEAAWRHPEIAASWGWVEVRLNTHDAGGITDRDFALARKIEEVVGWQPGREGAGLDGTPNDDPRFAYIRYD